MHSACARNFGQLACVLRCRGVRSLASRTPALTDEIDRFAHFNPTTLSLKKFIDFGAKNASAEESFIFLSKELPVRLANIMKEFCLLPEPLLQTLSVQQVEEWYAQSFQDMLKFQNVDPSSENTLKKFNETLNIIRNRHSSVVETMAQGVLEMKQELPDSVEISPNIENCIQYFLDRFYMSRISIRMLIHHHLVLFTKLDRNRRHIESIDIQCDVKSIVEDAYDNARFLCEQYYATAPGCDIECHNPHDSESGDKIVIPYVPTHLHHMMFELMKNALRAVVEHHSQEAVLPKLKVLICKGKKDVTIKLLDEGGGICRSELPKLFNYMYSTAPRPPSPDAADSTPLAGYGYGLPLSRLYAKYFNGDLCLYSVDGFGTDAVVCLKLLPQDANELLPVFNKTSVNKYLQSTPVGDWSDSAHGFGGKSSTNGYQAPARRGHK